MLDPPHCYCLNMYISPPSHRVCPLCASIKDSLLGVHSTQKPPTIIYVYSSSSTSSSHSPCTVPQRGPHTNYSSRGTNQWAALCNLVLYTYWVFVSVCLFLFVFFRNKYHLLTHYALENSWNPSLLFISAAFHGKKGKPSQQKILGTVISGGSNWHTESFMYNERITAALCRASGQNMEKLSRTTHANK